MNAKQVVGDHEPTAAELRAMSLHSYHFRETWMRCICLQAEYSPMKRVQRWWHEEGRERLEPYISPCYTIVEVGDLTKPLGPPPNFSCGGFFAWFEVGAAR